MSQPRQSILAPSTSTRSRRLQTVPYVEIFGDRLMGVVSSKSDYTRVYVSFVEAGTTDFNCSTNNNRPCGGLRGSPCKHIVSLLDEAVVQYGGPRVARALKLQCDPESIKRGRDVLAHISGSKHQDKAAAAFARFLNYLRYVEMPDTSTPVPEMAWFIAG
jgi:hypothetical protein